MRMRVLSRFLHHAKVLLRGARNVTTRAFAFTRSNLASELRTATSCHFFKHSLNISPTYRYSFPPSLARSLSPSLFSSLALSRSLILMSALSPESPLEEVN
eukprot:Tamp_25832.p1 GENE.Tamp_25832~~Tamp_25832.p1  ORF type:complete len:101 (-),score=2.90 Tamp_25832:458-760(-)